MIRQWPVGALLVWSSSTREACSRSTSVVAEDVATSYQLRTNAYVTKPVDFDEFLATVRQIDDFHLGVVKLPARAV